MSFELPPLPYAQDALQPFMGAETLEYHHGKHHQAYVTQSNNLVQGTGLEGKTLEEVVQASYGKPELTGLFNNASQHLNHLHFWKWMKPNGGGSIPGELEAKLTEDFGSVDEFKAQFIQAGVTQFGSGWCWLTMNNGKLAVTKTPNGESPIAYGGVALLGCDVWEHSYYLDYRNARPKYLEAWVNSLVNWEYVAELYGQAG